MTTREHQFVVKKHVLDQTLVMSLQLGTSTSYLPCIEKRVRKSNKIQGRGANQRSSATPIRMVEMVEI